METITKEKSKIAKQMAKEHMFKAKSHTRGSLKTIFKPGKDSNSANFTSLRVHFGKAKSKREPLP